MARYLGAEGEPRALGQVVDRAHEPRSGTDGLLAQFEAVVRRGEALDVGQNRSAPLVDPEVARSTLEPGPFEVKE